MSEENRKVVSFWKIFLGKKEMILSRHYNPKIFPKQQDFYLVFAFSSIFNVVDFQCVCYTLPQSNKKKEKKSKLFIDWYNRVQDTDNNFFWSLPRSLWDIPQHLTSLKFGSSCAFLKESIWLDLLITFPKNEYNEYTKTIVWYPISANLGNVRWTTVKFVLYERRW